MIVNSEYLVGKTIDEIHFKLIRRMFQVGRKYVIAEGSYAGHKRLQFDFVVFGIEYPGTRPLAPQLPQGVPSVTDGEAIKEYFLKYIMSKRTSDTEVYTYGDYIEPQLDRAIQLLSIIAHGSTSRDGNTNQATITIGDIRDISSIQIGDIGSIQQKYPPCLRSIGCNILEGALNFFLHFRSWDLWGGLPENLGGLQLLKEYMSEAIGVRDGEILGFSQGMHLYDFQWPFALARLHGKMPENAIMSKEEAELGEGWMSI